MAFTTLQIDPQVVQSLRQILGDTDPSNQAYSEMRLVEALRTQRQSIRVRDPLLLQSGISILYRYNRRIPVPKSDVRASILQWESGGASAQVDKSMRYWDSGVTPEVWVNAVKFVSGVDYTTDYVNGRITFLNSTTVTLPIEDWKPVQASFVYYKIFHAAKNVVATRNLAFGRPVSLKLGDDSFIFASPKEALAALDEIIMDLSPKEVFTDGRRIY